MAACRLDRFSRLTSVVESFCRSYDRLPCLSACNDKPVGTSAWHPLDQPLLECLGRCPNQYSPGRIVNHLSGASGLPDGRRDRSHTLSKTDLAKEVAGVGNSSRGGPGNAPRSGSIL